jgi:hypothetical protein
MAARQYIQVHHQDGRLDHRSDPLDAVDAYESLSVSVVLHLVTGWSVELCSSGFHAEKGGVHRSEHLEPLPAPRSALPVPPRSLTAYGRVDDRGILVAL